MARLNNHIKKLRFVNEEMSQETLANMVGVSRQTIHSIEKGKFIPSTLLAFKISRVFNLTVEDVFYISE